MAEYRGSLLGLLCETPLHPGAGQSADVVDLPVAREGATGLPQIPETGVKGALKEWFAATDETAAQSKTKRIFGTSESGAGGGAGIAIFSTARLLCLPVRRLDDLYGWMTCPYLLTRLVRDAARLGTAIDFPVLNPQEEKAFACKGGAKHAFFEEYVFNIEIIEEAQQAQLRKGLGKLVGKTLDILFPRMTIISDCEFSHFSANALPVDARNKLGDNKSSENLWYEETIPPDSLFYTLVSPRNTMVADDIRAFVASLDGQFVRFGGNETVGHGWTAVKNWEIAS